MTTTKITLSTIILLAFFASNNVSIAQCLLDQNQPLTDGGTSERNLPGYYDGQTFTAGVDGMLCEIDLMMFNPMAGTMTLNIYSGSGIGGTLLATQGVNVNVPTGQVWQDWTIETPPLIHKDSVYTFEFVPDQGGGLPDPYGVNIQGSDVYAGGYDLTFPQFDMTFRTYVDRTTGINEQGEQPAFSVYPNPAQDNFIILFNEQEKIENGELKIFDATCRIVYEQEIHSQLSTVNCQLSPGIYFVKIYSKQTIVTRKVIIQ